MKKSLTILSLVCGIIIVIAMMIIKNNSEAKDTNANEDSNKAQKEVMYFKKENLDKYPKVKAYIEENGYDGEFDQVDELEEKIEYSPDSTDLSDTGGSISGTDSKLSKEDEEAIGEQYNLEKPVEGDEEKQYYIMVEVIRNASDTSSQYTVSQVWSLESTSGDIGYSFEPLAP